MLLTNFIDQKTCNEIVNILDMSKPSFKGLNAGDKQITNDTTEAYDRALEKIHFSITDKISAVFNKTLVPSKDYSRIYTKGADLAPHIDGDWCEYSVTINICNVPESGRWPFYVTDHTNTTTQYLMNPGDAVAYYGPYWKHWRKPLEYDKCYQAFFHYVDINGTNAKYRNLHYDEYTRI